MLVLYNAEPLDIALAVVVVVAVWAVESVEVAGEKLKTTVGVVLTDIELGLKVVVELIADYVFDSFYLHLTEQPRLLNVEAYAQRTYVELFLETSPCHFLFE